ncbi:hypothetical protein CEUSTIGMA_g12558.t1, partial [Chlamydomonas eustigma]
TRWVLPNRAAFPTWFYEGFKDSEDDSGLFVQQRIVRDFIGTDGPHKGLILYHGLGVGKTCAAIATAVSALANNNAQKVIVLTQASLRQYFKEEMVKCAKLDRHDARFVFLAYNNSQMDTDLIPQEYFDNAIIIIDEVHRFVSRAMKPSSSCHTIFGRIMKSKSKRLLLSGTPIINEPFELSLLLNLAHGYQDSYVVSGPRAGLPQHPRVDQIVFKSPKVAIVQLYPPGFERSSTAETVQRSQDTMKPEDFLGSDVRLVRGFLLPMDPDDFEKMFLDGDNIKNQLLFLRRMSGLVSHFDERNPELYPRVLPRHIVKVPMSDHQFGFYSRIRIDEIKRERQAASYRARNLANNTDSEIANYKTFSRIACNFVFPEGITRPRPKVTRGENANEVYNVRLGKALHQVEEALAKDPQLIEKCSPKMHLVVRAIANSTGSCVLYSEFRTAEGIRLLEYIASISSHETKNKNSEVLERLFSSRSKWATYDPDTRWASQQLRLFNSELNADKYPEDKEIQEELVKMYGSYDNRRGEIVKCLLISVSGSEGISLKNVRHVHILEPYWNDIRIQQVIGRAVRAGSHLALKPEEREVDVVLYCSCLTETQKKDAFILRNTDQGKTADELLLELADRKTRVSNDFLELLRRGSIDCNIHRPGKCFNHDTRIPDEMHIVAPILDLESDDVTYVRRNITGKKLPHPVKRLLLRGVDNVEFYAYRMSDDRVVYADIYDVTGRLRYV